MPTAQINGITMNYELEGDGPETLVLVNGLADDLESWGFQIPDLLAAGIRVLRFDNRGIGKTDAPAGPYTSRQLADDTKALVDHLGITDFHLMGVSMGGMIVQEYALAYGSDLRSLTLACTYAAPGPFCSRMFSMWGDLAPVLGVPFVMRDVTLWAFTVPFFSDRPDDAKEFEDAMASMDMSVDAYLAQLNVIQTHDTSERLGANRRPDAGAGRRGGHPHPRSPVQGTPRPRPRGAVGDDAGRPRLPLGAPGALQSGPHQFHQRTRALTTGEHHDAHQPEGPRRTRPDSTGGTPRSRCVDRERHAAHCLQLELRHSYPVGKRSRHDRGFSCCSRNTAGGRSAEGRSHR